MSKLWSQVYNMYAYYQEMIFKNQLVCMYVRINVCMLKLCLRIMYMQINWALELPVFQGD